MYANRERKIKGIRSCHLSKKEKEIYSRISLMNLQSFWNIENIAARRAKY